MCFHNLVMRSVVRVIGLLLSLVSLPAATLELLSLDDMITQSTGIVRGRISSSYAEFRGPIIYTHYQVQVLDRWKGTGQQTSVDVAITGGSTNGYRQSFPGSPQLTEGKEYVLFLWTSKSGLTQVIGLTQGILDVSRDARGVTFASRPASSNTIIDPRSGQVIPDQPISLQLSDLTARISDTLARSGTK